MGRVLGCWLPHVPKFSLIRTRIATSTTPKAPAGSSLDGQPVVYLCGNSLGLQPRATHQYVQKQLEKWGEEAVEGHFTEPTKWLTIDDTVQDSLARLVGALPHEVVAMNSLTVNLHLMVGKVNLL